MDRRYYLGVLATGLLAGCGGTESVEPPTETERSPEETAPEPTDSPTTESDTSSEPETERETETMYPLSEVPEPEVEEEK